MSMSLSRERLKFYSKLKQKKYRVMQKRFIVEGFRGVRDVILADREGALVEAVVHTSGFLDDEMNQKLLVTARDRGSRVYEVSPKEIGRLTETVTPQDVVAIVRMWSQPIDTILNRPEPLLVVASDNIREPGNLGALIRTCDWFAVDTLLLGRGSVEPWNPKVVRAAVGSMVHLPFIENVELATELPKLRSKGYSVVAASVRGGVSITESVPSLPTVIIFGNEAEGISEEVSGVIDQSITIPKCGNAESLNVGVAAGIILYSIRFRNVKDQ